MSQNGTCYIVGAGDFDATRFCPDAKDYVIAADAGLTYIEEAGFSADLIVGDFDSLHYFPQGKEVSHHPVEKDDTDMALAAEAALEKGYQRLYFFGMCGGRIDHTLANFQLITDLSKRGVEVFVFCPDCTITALAKGSLEFSEAYYGIISVLAAEDRVEGVTLRGLKYPLEKALFTNRKPLGVSNEFMGKPATISVEKGVLWIIWQESRRLELPNRCDE